MIVRIVGVVFAVIESALVLRLLLPFVNVPKALQQYVPGLVAFTDALVAPFRAIVEPFDLGSTAGIAGANEFGVGQYMDKVDPAVLVAIVGWGVIAGVVTIVLRLVTRAA